MNADLTTLTAPLLVGLVAGYLVNLVADLVPDRQPLHTGWLAPICLGPLAVPRRLYRHIVVYLAAMALAVLALRAWGLTWEALVTAVYAWFFLAVAVIDLEHRRVLNRMLAPAALMAALLSLVLGTPRPGAALMGAAIGFLFFLGLRLIYPRGMGMGDVKLAGVIGLVIGFPNVITALFIGILAGGVAALAVLIVHRGRRGQLMAYAPYLVIGAWFALLVGPVLAGPPAG